jgi:glycosyltransferase involved in cell wall biosynthesis
MNTKNLLVITQKVDEDDDLLGFFIGWLREFSKRFDKVFVITLTKGRYTLPANVEVYSLGKEKNNSKIIRAWNFYKLLFRLTPKSGGIFAHMSPIFAVASWPIAVVYRKKIILWYLHRSTTFRLKLADLLSYKIVTASKESLRLKSDKILEVGHGIDIDRFRNQKDLGPVNNGKTIILSVGRISKIKNYETLVHAARILKSDKINFEIKIVGRPIMGDDFKYYEYLKSLVSQYNLDQWINFAGVISYQDIPPFYKQADILVNLAPTGGIDKTVLEAMASKTLPLVSNKAFEKYLRKYSNDLIFKHQDAQDLANRIKAILNLDNTTKKEIAEYLFQIVEEYHNQKKLIENIYHVFETLG